MKSSELIRLLQKGGWRIESQKGSHLKMIHPGISIKLIVPSHGSKEVGPGLCKKILREAGLK